MSTPASTFSGRAGGRQSAARPAVHRRACRIRVALPRRVTNRFLVRYGSWRVVCNGWRFPEPTGQERGRGAEHARHGDGGQSRLDIGGGPGIPVASSRGRNGLSGGARPPREHGDRTGSLPKHWSSTRVLCMFFRHAPLREKRPFVDLFRNIGTLERLGALAPFVREVQPPARSLCRPRRPGTRAAIHGECGSDPQALQASKGDGARLGGAACVKQYGALPLAPFSLRFILRLADCSFGIREGGRWLASLGRGLNPGGSEASWALRWTRFLAS
jgi:hypothetical protein